MNSAETKTFKIGVDGGATKTELILVDGTGAVIARQTAPGSNPSLIGPDRARAVLRDALRSLVAGIPPGRIDRLLLCMAGSQSFWEETAAELGEFGRAEAFSDSLPVLELATGGAHGLVVPAGTKLPGMAAPYTFNTDFGIANDGSILFSVTSGSASAWPTTSHVAGRSAPLAHTRTRSSSPSAWKCCSTAARNWRRSSTRRR